MYQLLPDTLMGAATCIKRIADNAFIPFDNSNTDYIEYLHWLSLGNTPLEAEVSIAVQPTEQLSLTTKGDNIV